MYPVLVQLGTFELRSYGIIGALLGGFLTALWYCRKKQLSFWRFADTLAPGVALVLAAIAGFYILGEASGSRREL